MDIHILNMIMLVRNKIERFTRLRTRSSRRRSGFVACLLAGDVLDHGDIKLKLARGFAPLPRSSVRARLPSRPVLDANQRRNTTVDHSDRVVVWSSFDLDQPGPRAFGVACSFHD
jgi:hypothetical protein